MEKIIKAGKEVLKYTVPGYGLVSVIEEQFINANKRSNDVLETKDEGKIRSELLYKEMETRIRELDAKIAQELAISKRIENAEVVEIEEYYEGMGKGSLGANIKEKDITIGVSGEGKKVTKRIYRFTGFLTE